MRRWVKARNRVLFMEGKLRLFYLTLGLVVLNLNDS